MERPHTIPARERVLSVRTPEPKPDAPESVPRGGARFRTGLTEEDLNLTPLETRDFE